tara:strand:+ start:1128 stop:1319 length:192 start_codon:yes stop_codon:yes gene_type:complete
MPNKNAEEYIVRSVRVPARIWEQLKLLANKGYRPLNSQLIRVIEDWLVDHEYMDNNDRMKLDQ